MITWVQKFKVNWSKLKVTA